MAKKVVASMQKGTGRVRTKCIKLIKSPKSGAYAFKEEMINNAEIQDFFKSSN